MFYRYRVINPFNFCLSVRTQTLGGFYRFSLIFLLVTAFFAANASAQPRLEKLGVEERLLEVAPYQAELKQDGYVYLDESRYVEPYTVAERDGVLEAVPTVGSGRAVYVPNASAPVLLSDKAVFLRRTNNSPLVAIFDSTGIYHLDQEEIFYRLDGEKVDSPSYGFGYPASVRGVSGEKIISIDSSVGAEAEYTIYDAQSGVLSNFVLPQVDPLTLPQFIEVFGNVLVTLGRSDPTFLSTFLPLNTSPVNAVSIFAIENGIIYGYAMAVNANAGANPNTQSLLSTAVAPFALFPDGSSVRYLGGPVNNPETEVEQGVIFNGGSFATADGEVKFTSPHSDIFGVSVADGFVYGTGSFFNPDTLGIFSLEDGAEIASLDVGGKVYDVDYLGDGKFNYLADIDGALIRGQVQVVPLPAAVWLFATALFGLLSLRRMSR